MTTTLDVAEQMNEAEKRKYIKGRRLGEGTYAVVFLGQVRARPTTLVAIKKIKVQREYREGMAPDAVRELRALQELRHPNVVSLLSVFSSKDQNLNLVLEYLPRGDLEDLIRDVDAVRYGAADVKAWMRMLVRAVAFCHDAFILHRDIKPNNLLIAADGEVKLADFGLARPLADPLQPMTHTVVTRWYRPPELLFGARHYGGCVDIWSVGCVFAELVNRVPYLAGASDVHQLALICQYVGTPAEDNWPGVSRLPSYALVPPPPEPPHPVRGRDHYTALFGTLGADGVDLLMRTLVLDPRRRISARDMLRHPWWDAHPAPTRKEDLPRMMPAPAPDPAADLKRRPGAQLEDQRGAKLARRLEFGKK